MLASVFDAGSICAYSDVALRFRAEICGPQMPPTPTPESLIPATAMVGMVGSYDYRLVTLSILISLLAAYGALELAERITTARGEAWFWWVIGGAAASGLGTWSMHYTGMLSFSLPVPVCTIGQRYCSLCCPLSLALR